MAFEKEMIAAMNNPQALEAWRVAQVCDEMGYAAFSRYMSAESALLKAGEAIHIAADFIEESERRAFLQNSELFAGTAFQFIWMWGLVLAGLK